MMSSSTSAATVTEIKRMGFIQCLVRINSSHWPYLSAFENLLAGALAVGSRD